MAKGIGKIVTTVVSSIALVGSVAAISVFVLNDSNVTSLSESSVNYYNGKFYDYDDSLLHETGLTRRGDPLTYPATIPTTYIDDDNNLYQFIGWDVDGNNIPDVLGDRIYYNFSAKAVYFKVPQPPEMDPETISNILNAITNVFENLNIELTEEQIQAIIDYLTGLNLDLSDIDINVLKQILDILGMDIMDFIEALGLDMETALALLNAPVLSYSATNNTLPHFFRSRSFGDYKNGKWSKGDFYSKENISEGSINPLEYTMNKLSKSITPIDYEFQYHKSGQYYPVPAYEMGNEEGLESESYSLIKPTPAPTEENPKQSTYSTTGYGFYPASAYSILIMKGNPYSNNYIEEDELEYREYVKEKYLGISDKYKEYFLEFANEHEIVVNNESYGHISRINEVFKEYSMLDLTVEDLTAKPKDVDEIHYFLEDSKKGLSDIFATTTTLLYRALGIPARYVEGYFDINLENEPFRTIGGLQAHSWVEIYIDGIGWMMVDTSISNVIPPEMAELLFGNPFVDMNNQDLGELQEIEVEKTKTEYFQYEEISIKDLYIFANYDSGQRIEIKLHEPEEKEEDPLAEEEDENPDVLGRIPLNYPAEPYYFENEEGTQALTIYVGSNEIPGETVIKVFFVDQGVPAVATIPITIIEPKIIKLEIIEGSYQMNYFVGNELNITGLAAIGTYNDPSRDPVRLHLGWGSLICDEYTNGEIDTSIPGLFEYEVYVREFPEVKATFQINVVEYVEEIIGSATLLNLLDNQYSTSYGEAYKVVKDKEFDLSQLDMTVFYVEGFNRKLDVNRDNVRVEGDFSQTGYTYADVILEENGHEISETIRVRVRGHDTDLDINVTNFKEYDGISFAKEELITIQDPTNPDDTVIEAGERIETRISDSEIDFEQFYDVSNYYALLEFRIVDEKGEPFTDIFFDGSERTMLHYYDEAGDLVSWEYHYGEDGFEADEEGWIDLDYFQFVIKAKEIHIKTLDAQLYSNGYFYIPSKYTNTYNRNDLIDSSGIALVSGDYIDYDNISWIEIGSNINTAKNRFNINTLKIYSTYRIDNHGYNVDVTNNYVITTTWGVITRV